MEILVKRQMPYPLTLRPLDVTSKRRVGSVNIPLLLFAVLAGEQNPRHTVVPGWRVLLGQACDAPKNQEPKTLEILLWLRSCLERMDGALERLDDDPRFKTLEYEQVDLIIIAAQNMHDPRAEACSPSERAAAEYLAGSPLHVTTPSTDPLIFTLEQMRLARRLGDMPQHPDVCAHCAYMDAMIGDLDPVCPLCEAWKRPRPAISGYPTERMRSILRACEPDAKIESL